MNCIICHHGIKGQKWGIRRFQNKDGSLTAKGRKRYGEDRYKLHDDGKIEIEKGAELQRIIDGKMSKTDLKGPTYASIGKNDNNQYMNILAKDGVSKVLKLTAKTSLKSPSTNEAADMYFKVLKDNPKALKEFKGMKDYAENIGLIKNFDKKLDDIIKGKKRYDDEPGERKKESKSEDRPSRGKRAVKAILRTVLVDTAVRSVSSHLVMSGKEEAGKALHAIGATYSWVALGKDAIDIIKNK